MFILCLEFLLPIITNKFSAMPLWHCAASPSYFLLETAQAASGQLRLAWWRVALESQPPGLSGLVPEEKGHIICSKYKSFQSECIYLSSSVTFDCILQMNYSGVLFICLGLRCLLVIVLLEITILLTFNRCCLGYVNKIMNYCSNCSSLVLCFVCRPFGSAI